MRKPSYTTWGHSKSRDQSKRLLFTVRQLFWTSSYANVVHSSACRWLTWTFMINSYPRASCTTWTLLNLNVTTAMESFLLRELVISETSLGVLPSNTSDAISTDQLQEKGFYNFDENSGFYQATRILTKAMTTTTALIIMMM